MDKGVGEPDIIALGGAGMFRPSSRARRGFTSWGVPATSAFVETVVAEGTKGVGVALFHCMRKVADVAGNGRWSWDGMLGASGTFGAEGVPRLGQRLADLGLDYRYFLASDVAPTESILAASLSWHEFQTAYLNQPELDGSDLDRLLFQVVAAAAGGMRPILLCCEPYVPCWHGLSDQAKRVLGCHRFFLAKRLASRAGEVALFSLGGTPGGEGIAHLDVTTGARALVRGKG